ncbi:MAG: hypothetical protein IIA89_12230 [Chloroflexi bacterium]|nr:hypothetical protein [Chloroflexota bacterium]
MNPKKFAWDERPEEITFTARDTRHLGSVLQTASRMASQHNGSNGRCAYYSY